MSRFTLIVLGFALYGASAAADVLIQNITIVTPEHAKPLLHQHVLIRGERIAQVSSQPIRIANAVERINGTNRFLTPGLMDAHVHLSEAPGLPPGSNDPQHQRLRESFFRRQPRSYLYFGVTHLLDPVSFDAATTLFESQPAHPDVFRCGAAPALDGYPSLFVPTPMRYEVFAYYIFEPANASKHPLPAGAKAEEHTPEAVIGRIAASGARCVKVFVEPGFGRAKDWPLLSAQTLARVRAETRKRGLLMVAHANSLRAQRMAVAAQVDVIAHGLWNWDEESDKQGVPPAIAAHLREVRANRIGFQPTLRVLPGMADLFRHDTLRDPYLKKVVPSELLAWYSTASGQWFAEQTRNEFGNAPDIKIQHIHLRTAAQGMRAAKFLHELGHPLLLGSDTPSAPTFGNQPGYDTYREMRLMAQSGIPLDAIFRAGTINNARLFKLDKDYGTVETGKIANLLLLETNPLETVRAWSMIQKIVLRGKIIERETLAADAARDDPPPP